MVSQYRITLQKKRKGVKAKIVTMDHALYTYAENSLGSSQFLQKHPQKMKSIIHRPEERRNDLESDDPSSHLSLLLFNHMIQFLQFTPHS